MSLLLFLHIFTMFGAVAILASQVVLVTIAARTGQLLAIPVIASISAWWIGPGLLFTGGLLGAATAVALGHSLVAPWLLISYVLFAGVAGWGARVSGPTLARLAELINAEGPHHPSPELRHLVGQMLPLDVVVTTLLIALLIADMVFRPFN